MALQYKIIPLSILDGALSEFGEVVLSTARLNNYGTKAILCVNHSKERIAKAFNANFDFESLLLNLRTYSNQEALDVMSNSEWRTIEAED
jgi:hypothetical protein